MIKFIDMKKVGFLFASFIVLLTSFVFVSCDKEEDFDSAGLVGDWILIREEGYEDYDGERDDFDNEYPTADYWDYQEVFRFKNTEDGLKMTVLDYCEIDEALDESYYIKVEVRGDKIVPVFDGYDEDDFSAEEMTFEIVELTSTKMVLYNREKDIDGSFESTMTFKKLN